METMMKTVFAVGLAMTLALPSVASAQRSKSKKKGSSTTLQIPPPKPNTRTHAAAGSDSLRHRTYPTRKPKSVMTGKPFRRTVFLEQIVDGLARVRYIEPGRRTPRTVNLRNRKNVGYYLLSPTVKLRKIGRLVGRSIEVTLQPDTSGKLVLLDYRLAPR